MKNKKTNEMCESFGFPKIELNDIYEQQQKINYRLEVIFDIVEQIKIDLIDMKNDKRLKQAKEKKEDAERWLKEIELCKDHKYDIITEDRSRFNSYGDMEIR